MFNFCIHPSSLSDPSHVRTTNVSDLNQRVKEGKPFWVHPKIGWSKKILTLLCEIGQEGLNPRIKMTSSVEREYRRLFKMKISLSFVKVRTSCVLILKRLGSCFM